MKYLKTLGVAASAALLISSSAIASTFRTTQRMSGFSTDSNYYVHLESSTNGGSGVPTATLQVMTVGSNACVQNGCIATQYGENDYNLSQTQAEDSLLQRTWNLRQTLRLTPPQPGTRLRILSRSRTPNNTEVLTVQLPNRPQMRLQLQQRHIPSALFGGTANVDRASMQLEASYGNRRQTLGSLSSYRDLVIRYSIRDLYLSPDGQSVAILVTATRPDFEGVLETTLVQSLDL